MTHLDRAQTAPDAQATDDRSDIEQAVTAPSDALKRDEGGVAADDPAGECGADGVVKNQGDLEQ